VVDTIVFDQRPWAAAPDFDAQPFAPGPGDPVFANDQFRRVIAKDAAPACAADDIPLDAVAGAKGRRNPEKSEGWRILLPLSTAWIVAALLK